MPLSNILEKGQLHSRLPARRLFAIWAQRWGLRHLLFPYDERMAVYLEATGRKESVAADGRMQWLPIYSADAEVVADPSAYYDRVIEIDLSELGTLY